MSPLVCKSCGYPLLPGDRLCPICGSGDRDIFVSDEGRGTETITIEDKKQGFRRFRLLRKWAEKISRKTRSPAQEYLEIDKEKRRKYHHVEEQDESGNWRTVHHHDGPLDQAVPSKDDRVGDKVHRKGTG